MPVSELAKTILAKMLGRNKPTTAEVATHASNSPPANSGVVQPVVVERVAMRPRGAQEYAYEMRHFRKSYRVRMETIWLDDDDVFPQTRYVRIRGRRPARKPRYKTEHSRRRL